MISKNSSIFIAGHKGFVGNAVLERLRFLGYKNIIIKNKTELNLLDQSEVNSFFTTTTIDYVILCAAKVGGIAANIKNPASFLYENLQIQNNVIHASYLTKVKKLIFLASSCIYPRNCLQPMKEEYLLQGDFEPTNYGYAMAKAAGVKMCQAYNEQYNANFLAINPSNLYGVGDNFDPETSHAMAALIRKVVTAKQNGDDSIILWGDGSAMREWLYIEDLAEIIVEILEKNISGNMINVGTGKDISMLDLINLIAKIVDYKGEVVLDPSKPNGMPRKVMQIDKMLNLGIKSKTDLVTGIRKTYDWYLRNADKIN